MRKIICTLILFQLITLGFAQSRVEKRYRQKLDSLIASRDSSVKFLQPAETPSAYSMRLFMPSTFYGSSIMQQFSYFTDTLTTDRCLLEAQMVNDVLAQTYVSSPWLISQTASQLGRAGYVRNDVNDILTSNAILTAGIDSVTLPLRLEGFDKVMDVAKPHFWTFSGNGSLQFTQSHFSSNWYQGGDDNYAGLALVTVNANFDNKRKIQWENTLDMQLGFQTNESDTHHKFKTTSNMLRLNSKFGYRAFKNFYYTTQLLAQTQLAPLYENNSDQLKTKFLNPLNVALSVGLDWKFSFFRKRFTGDIYVAPCSYDLKYVSDTDLATKFGIDEGCHAFHNVGPSATIKWNLTPWKNISWDSRMYCISNFHYFDWEWENTISFTVNKYIAAKVFLYPRFDDSSEAYKSESSGYFMFKEWLSLGLSYDF